MTYIDPRSELQGEIIRKTASYNSSGAVASIADEVIVGAHRLDLQPLSAQERFASEQFKIKATHEVYPEPQVFDLASPQLSDFYRIDGRDYKIVAPYDFRTLGYFRVLDGEFGTPSKIYRRRQAYAISGLGPGDYTFGSGALANVPAFSAAPWLLEAIENHALWAVTNVTATGFTVLDMGVGVLPSLTVYLWSDLGVTETDRFYVTGLTAGNYTFGSGALVNISAFSQTPDIIGGPRNAGWYWIQNSSATGFTVADAGIGVTPAVDVLIRAKPTATDRRWSFSGLGEGSYTFGTSPLSGMPSTFLRAPMVLVQPNNSGRVFRPTVTTTGFTITWTGEGVSPSVTVVIQES